MELHSYHSPALEAGKYEIIVKQNISAPGTTNPVPWHSQKPFFVVGPRFSIPAADVNSTYPPEDGSEEPRVLPHVVFNNAHLLWERSIHPTNKSDINRTPWMALLTFTEDELSKFLPDSGMSVPPKLTSTLAFEGRLSFLLEERTGILCPNLKAKEEFPDQVKNQVVSFISLEQDKFMQLFGNQEDSKNSQATLSLDRFKYFAHVRTLDVQGTTLHPAASSPVSKSFGLLTSHRCGPLNVVKPTTVFVHLLSLDGVQKVGSKDQKIVSFDGAKIDNVQRVNIVSLLSWTYKSLPPLTDTDKMRFEHLKSSIGPLRRPQAELDALRTTPTTSKNESARKWLAARLESGYTFVHHRLFSGEQATAIYRGPFQPSPSSSGRAAPTQVGMDLQILDKETGMIDVSYSVAWELGRTLAAADRAFTAALMRLRIKCFEMAYSDTSSNKTDAISVITQLAQGNLSQTTPGSQNQSNVGAAPQSSTPTAANNKPSPLSHVSILEQGLATRVRSWLDTAVTSQIAIETAQGADKPQALTDIPSTWSIVLNWIKGKLDLKDIPTIYLLPDPATLQDESIATFYIDQSWLEAFVDGALSIANHTTYVNDPVKREIKRSINEYLRSAADAFGPQRALPLRWGFLLRSKLIRSTPNMIIRAIPKENFKPIGKEMASGAVGLGLSNVTALDDKTIMYMQHETPQDPLGVKAVLISQPHHHQRFSVGDELDAKHLDFTFNLIPGVSDARITKPITTTSEPGTLVVFFSPEELAEGQPPVVFTTSPIFDWDSRCLQVRGYLEACAGVVQISPGPFGWKDITSAICAVQLNDGIHELDLTFPEPGKQSGPVKAWALYNPQEDSKPANTTTANDQPKITPDTTSHPPPTTTTTTTTTTPATNTPAAKIPARVRHGFDVKQLGETKATAPPTIPDGSTSATRVYKSCSPLLPVSFRNIPVPLPDGVELDLIFSIYAISTIPPDLNIVSVIVRIPVGNHSTDLLRQVSARPSIRMLARNQRWTFHTSLSTNADTLIITVLPRDEARLQLGQSLRINWELGFVLQHAVIQNDKSDAVTVHVTETYSVKGTQTKIESSIVLTKQICPWVPITA